jgi:hypothetical protein
MDGRLVWRFRAKISQTGLAKQPITDGKLPNLSVNIEIRGPIKRYVGSFQSTAFDKRNIMFWHTSAISPAGTLRSDGSGQDRVFEDYMSIVPPGMIQGAHPHTRRRGPDLRQTGLCGPDPAH